MFRKSISKLFDSRVLFGLVAVLVATMTATARAANLYAESYYPSVVFYDADNPGFGWELMATNDGDLANQSTFWLGDKFSNIPFLVRRPSAVGGTNNDGAFAIEANGHIGLGTFSPVRQLHMRGSDAVFRMDRSTDTAAFMLVRTGNAPTFTPLKTFVVGTNASASNTGEFVINDLGTAVGGPGTRRMTIGDTGDVTFTGSVTATAFFPSSSERLKKDVSTLTQAREAIEKLRGVRFAWKESGQASVGLIAEEVAKVFPELVLFDGGQAKGVNYNALVAVLIEALKEQNAELAAAKRQQQSELSAIKTRLVELEQLLLGQRAKLNLH